MNGTHLRLKSEMPSGWKEMVNIYHNELCSISPARTRTHTAQGRVCLHSSSMLLLLPPPRYLAAVWASAAKIYLAVGSVVVAVVDLRSNHNDCPLRFHEQWPSLRRSPCDFAGDFTFLLRTGFASNIPVFALRLFSDLYLISLTHTVHDIFSPLFAACSKNVGCCCHLQ